MYFYQPFLSYLLLNGYLQLKDPELVALMAPSTMQARARWWAPITWTKTWAKEEQCFVCSGLQSTTTEILHLLGWTGMLFWTEAGLGPGCLGYILSVPHCQWQTGVSPNLHFLNKEKRHKFSSCTSQLGRNDLIFTKKNLLLCRQFHGGKCFFSPVLIHSQKFWSQTNTYESRLPVCFSLYIYLIST